MQSENAAEASNVPQRVELANLDQSNPKLDRLLYYSAIFYFVFVVVIGLPIWYASTTTYRASLPYSDISQLPINQFEITVGLEIVNFNVDRKADAAKFERDLFTQLQENTNSDYGLKINFKGKLRSPTDNELKIMMESSSLLGFDQKFSSSSLNQLRVVLLDGKALEKLQLNSQNEFLNNLYINFASTTDAKTSVDVILNQYLHLNQLSDALKGKQDAKRKLPNKEELRRLNFDKDYEITFTLINSNPKEFNLNWNIESSVQKYFANILSQLNPFVNIQTKSQELYYSDVEANRGLFKQSTDKTYYFLNSNDLSIVTNIIESRIGSHQSDSTKINFVTYIPTKQPLHIVNGKEGFNEKLNSFIVPRWGGVYIDNHLSETTNSEMRTFLTQFLQILGIQLHNTQFNTNRSALFNSEQYGYLLAKTLENLSSSINTLQSLASLLEKISNMVIDDDIGKLVHSSIDSIKLSFNHLKNGELAEAFNSSRVAFVASEKAFFDPSLLALLYFPEDQTFAIYVPLFIPTGLPLLLSLKFIPLKLKSWLNARKQKAE